MTSERFFEFIRFAMAPTAEPPRHYTEEEWMELFELSSKQSLLGVTMAAVDAIPRREGPSLRIYARWAMFAEKLEKANRHFLEVSADLSSEFQAAGMRSCVLKGQGTAALYPQPLRRQSGDIDIWVEGGCDKVLSYLKGYEFGEIVYHHCDPKDLRDVKVEVHFMPSWMNSFILDRRLRKWFDAEADTQFENRSAGLGFSTPTPAFAAVFSLLHVFRHVMDEGIGLRQLMDYYYILKALPASDRAMVSATIQSLRLTRFARAVMHVMKVVFEIEDDSCFVSPDSRLGAFLLEEVMIAGNFGFYDKRNAHRRGESRVAKTLRKTRRQFRFFGLCPREVLAAPIFKFWQYCWRKRKKFL